MNCWRRRRAGRAVTAYRQLAGARPDAFLPDLATSLNNLAIQLGGVGRREDALTAIEEAVSIRRRLHDKHPNVRGERLEQSLQVRSWLEADGEQ
jgi:hypothetical protein